MNSQNLVVRAIDFDGPARVPMFFPSLDEVDMIHIQLFPDLEGWDLGRGGKDEWGCIWSTVDKTMGRPEVHPLSSWKKLDGYKFPDSRDKRRFKEAKRQFLKIRPLRKYVVGSNTFTLFERMHFLRGFNNLMADFHLNKDRVLVLADRVLELQMELVKQWSKVGVDGVYFSDDWGYQTGLFVSPGLWREIFKPRYTKLFHVAHEEGMHAFFHSDGKIYDVIPDFIECGADVLVIQLKLNDINSLGSDFGGKVCFAGGVDYQTTLVYGTRDEIRREAELLVRNLGRLNGGFIAQECDELEALGIPKENNKIMHAAFKEFGRY